MLEPVVLAREPGWVAIDKPAGWLVIPGRPLSSPPAGAGESPAPSLRAITEAKLGQKLFVVHRLDRDTSGVLLFATTAAAHRTLSMAFEAGQVEKRYLALVRGAWSVPEDVELALVEGRKGRMRTARAGERGKLARTRFSPLERFADSTWVEAIPLTGRTHQIRVHAAAVGHPLLVDPRYGDGGATMHLGNVHLTRTPLHAERLRIPALRDTPPAEIHAPLPADLTAALEALRHGV